MTIATQRPRRTKAAVLPDLRVNDCGVYVEGTEKTCIGMRKSHRTKAWIECVEVDRQKNHWRSAIHVEFGDAGRSEPLTVNSPIHPSHGHALLDAIDRIIVEVRRRDESTAAKRKRRDDALHDLRGFRDKVRRNYRLPPVHPGLTSTTTPGGILANDPDAIHGDPSQWRELLAGDGPFAAAGQVVRTSYGTGPYVIQSIKQSGKDRAGPKYSLVVKDQAAKRRGPSYLNDYQRQADGRITNGQDELVVLPAGTDGGAMYFDWLDAAGLDGSDELQRRWMLGQPAREASSKTQLPVEDEIDEREAAEPAAVSPLAASRSRQMAAPEYRELPIQSIDPSPSNPRKHFDAEELRELAVSLKSAAGIVEPLIVRRQKLVQTGGEERYELVAGERRWRAAKLAGLATVPAIVRRLNDREVLLAQVIENFQRCELNAIEEGQAFRRLTAAAAEGGAGYTQTELAVELGCTQAHVSNRVRLLEAPEAWQQRVITRDMPATHLRIVLPWLRYPALATALEKECRRRFAKGKSPPLEEWQRCAQFAVESASFPLADNFVYDAESRGYLRDVRIDPTDEQRGQLEIIELPRPNGKNGKPEERCLNKSLHAQLWRAALDAARERQAKRTARREANGKAPQPNAALRQRKKAADAAAQHQKRLGRWRIGWLEFLCSSRLTKEAIDRILLYVAADQAAQTQGSVSEFERCRRRRQELLVSLLEQAGVACPRKRQSYGPDRVDVWGGLSQLAKPGPTLHKFAQQCLWLWEGDQPGPAGLLPDDVIERLATMLSIDLAAAWRDDMAGPLTEEFFKLHTKEQLLELAEELGIHLEASKPKARKKPADKSAAMERYIAEIDRFATLLRGQQAARQRGR